MKNAKKIGILAIITISLVVIGGISYSHLVPQTIIQSAKWRSDVRKPEWLSQTSQLVVIGEVLDHKPSAKGKSPASGQEMIYTDTNVRVNKVVRIQPSLGINVKVGDVITVRTLGGQVDNQKMLTEDAQLITGEKAMLFLVNSPENRLLPSSSTVVYGVQGGVHGYFTLQDNGTAKRQFIGDSFKVQDLENTARSAGPFHGLK
jgi:hypothetical protein